MATSRFPASVVPIPVSTTMGISPHSGLYRHLQNGIMLVPGRLGDDVPEETEISMILDPENIETNCYQDSLFYLMNIQEDYLNVHQKFSFTSTQ